MNKSEIEQSLRDVGIQSGIALEVHSSLSSFGFIENGPHAIIEALQNIITGDGTIIMPSFLLSKSAPLTEKDIALGIERKNKFLSEDHSEETDMGIIADTFRNSENVITGKGLHRFSAWGRKAKEYTEDFNIFLNDDGSAILIGADITSLSAMHYVEYNIPENIWPELFPLHNQEIDKYYDRKQWFIKERGVSKYHKGWYKVQKEAIDNGIILQNQIGKSQCMFFKVNEVIKIYEKWIIKNINELFEI